MSTTSSSSSWTIFSSTLQIICFIFLYFCCIEIGYCDELKLNFTERYEGIDGVANPTRGLLYPRESETREVRTLDGIWRFLKSHVRDSEQGLREQWYKQHLDDFGRTIPMPVPASYNDITTSAALRDHVGTVWYERRFFVPHSWAANKQRVWLRFGSVHYAAYVYLNGHHVMSHVFGHLPFEADISLYVQFGSVNRVTVMCNNTLTNETIPQGQVTRIPISNGTHLQQQYTFDFFNYAGIHRSVHLYTTPTIYIEDVDVITALLKNGTGTVQYAVTINGGDNTNEIVALKASLAPYYVHVNLRDKRGHIVATQKVKKDFRGNLIVPNVNAWWPYLMHTEPGYMYRLEIYLHAADNTLLDAYRLPIGIRTVSWSNTSLLLNGEKVYMRGFGKHEDSDIRGKGLDFALITRDFNLLHWMGANAYRTSHYPYSEESMQMADEFGIMIIDECASVNTDFFMPSLLQNHMSAIEQLIHRDRNHPSVIMWSIANEPRSKKPSSEAYFRKLTNYTRQIAAGRPLTAAINVDKREDHLAEFLDIISFNRYNAWYLEAGELDIIEKNVYEEATAWFKQYKRPVLMTEYGADTMEGLHALPNFVWSEDYQTALLSKHFKAFDALRRQGWFIGEFLWNFADFKTEQTTTRVGGNKKGIFTRARQPKSAAHLLRQRYYALAHTLDGVSMPHDAFPYIIQWPID